MCVTVWVLRYKNKKNGDRGTIVFTVGYYSRRDVSQKGLLLVFFIASVITKIKNKK